MFSVMLQAYFSTRSSRSLKAGTYSAQHTLSSAHPELKVASGWSCSFQAHLRLTL